MRMKQEWSIKDLLLAGSTTLLILIGGFGAWATTTKISGAIVAPGRIEVEQNRQVVQHRDGGVVSEILVKEGDFVQAGQALISLDAHDLTSDLIITESQLFEIEARVNRLETERDASDIIAFSSEIIAEASNRAEVADLMEGQKRLFKARRKSIANEVEQLEKRRQQINDELIGIKAQHASSKTQIELIEEELLTQLGLLEKSLARKSTVLALQREKAEQEGSFGELVAAEAQARGKITEIDIEILKLHETRREQAITELRDLSQKRVELAENRRNLKERMTRLQILAPVSGIVYGMTVHTPQSVVRAADPVLYLVPQDRPLVIISRVSPTDIDQVHMDQPVTLSFSALDSRQTPELKGKVTQVSADAFDDERSGLSHYRVELQLTAGEADKLPNGTILVPGMPVESFIRTGDHTPMAYLLKPLNDYFAKALRETL